jgi:hypothetical protein
VRSSWLSFVLLTTLMGSIHEFGTMSPIEAVLVSFIIFVLLVIIAVGYRNHSTAVSELYSRLDGSRWMYLKDFSWQYLPSKHSRSYAILASKVSTVFSRFYPAGPGFKVVEDKRRRGSCKIQQAAVNCDFPYQVAHLSPHSAQCNSAWKPVYDPFIKANSNYNKEENLEMALYGFRVKGTSPREAHSGITHNRLNMLAVPHQFEGMDQKSTLALLPLEIDGQPVTTKSILEWSGQAFAALILIHTPKEGISYFGLNAEKTRDPPVVEMSSNDPQIENAINIFNEFLLLITACLGVETIEREAGRNNEAKVELCRMFREFVAQSSTKTIPCLQLPKRAGLVKVQYFPARPVVTPRTRQSEPRPRRSSSTLDFSSPHTFLLVLRALNCWFDWIHLKKIWPDWNTYFDRCLHRIKNVKMRNALRKARLVILPSCCDLNALDPDCVLCKCHILLNRPDAYPEIPCDLFEAAQMLVHGQVEPSWSDCQEILHLRPAERLRQESLVDCRCLCHVTVASILSTSDTAKGDS